MDANANGINTWLRGTFALSAAPIATGRNAAVVTVLETNEENAPTSTIIAKIKADAPKRAKPAMLCPSHVTTPVAARPCVIANSVNMKMTVSLAKPAKACWGVKTCVNANAHTTTSEVTSMGMLSIENNTSANTTTPDTIKMDIHLFKLGTQSGASKPQKPGGVHRSSISGA